jgi:hypothetical protein
VVTSGQRQNISQFLTTNNFNMNPRPSKTNSKRKRNEEKPFEEQDNKQSNENDNKNIHIEHEWKINLSVSIESINNCTKLRGLLKNLDKFKERITNKLKQTSINVQDYISLIDGDQDQDQDIGYNWGKP